MRASSLLRWFARLIGAWLLACAPAYAEPVVIERDAALLTQPRPDAPVAANVKQGTTGDASTKQGAWSLVKTSAGSGWILSFNLRYGSAQTGGGVDASALGRVVGPRQKLAVTSTIGVRGIEAEDLKQAQFNEQQVSLLEKYRVTNDQAQAAASASGLSAVSVKYLD